MKIRKIICADKGKILTNGITYGRMIFLADDENERTYYEIDEAEYKRTLVTDDEGLNS